MNKYWFSSKTAKKHIEGLDAFRGIAAFLVFIFHYWTFFILPKGDSEMRLFGLNFSAPFAAGHIGVDIFFVLSGFLLFLSLTRSWNNITSFFKRRILRLAPLAIFFTIIVFILRGPEYWQNSAEFPFKNLFYHLFFIQSLSLDTYWGLHPVMWTLTVEALFILLLPILLYLGKKKKWHFVLILAILIIVNFLYRAYIFKFFPEWSISERIFYSEQLWGRFDQFALGVILGIIWISDFKSREGGDYINLFSMLIGIFGFIFSMILFAHLGSSFRDYFLLQVFLHSIVSLSFVIFLHGFLSTNIKMVKGILAPKIFSYFGVISYSFFLWHFPILSVLKKVGLNASSSFFLSLFIGILVSVFTYFVIEKFPMRISKLGK